MIGKINLIQSKDFKVGLFTRSDIIQANPDFSPNCMDIKWYFDDSLGKRFGSTTTNNIAISSGGQVAGFIVGGSLTNNLAAYWKMDEASGDRSDTYSTNTLVDNNAITSIVGIRNNAALLASANSQYFEVNSQNSLFMNNGDFTFSGWFYLNATGAMRLIAINSRNGSLDYTLGVTGSGSVEKFSFQVQTGGGGSVTVFANSYGAATTSNWVNITCWNSAGSHIGISVNLSANSASGTTNVVYTTGATLKLGFDNTFGSRYYSGRMDELGFWTRVLNSTERANLYAGGSGNTYTGSTDSNSWYSFDFGASGARWLTVCAGSGIMASSNLGTTFVNIATTRTATFQYLSRSRNVLIATSDAYDQSLYWAGSAGTFAQALALNTAPKAKFSINYQGFLILMNYMNSNGVISNRGFSYQDENTQLTGAWQDSFDLPSSADDEITAPFILNRFLYVSTKYSLFRLNYTNGNPDWEYITVKNFGYVPRTVKVFTMKQGQVAVGLDWNRRLRAFDGYDDQIITDNVENANDSCEFAMDNISLVGSGLLISNAEFDSNEQEYRLNVAIGAQSTQTTHALVLNARTLALYPYANQPYNTMCMAESAGRQFLMGFDRSGLCHILNSGNLDAGVIPVNEIYDSPLLFKNSPSEVTKNKQINFFFSHTSSGNIYYQERFDFSNFYNPMKPLRDYAGNTALTGNESSLIISRTVDLPSVQNIYQFRLTSSSGTAIPWKLTHFDLFNTGLGVGRGK